MPAHDDPFTLNVGAKNSISRALGVTDVVPEHWNFTADFTFCHSFTSSVSIAEVIIPQREKDATGRIIR